MKSALEIIVVLDFCGLFIHNSLVVQRVPLSVRWPRVRWSKDSTILHVLCCVNQLNSKSPSTSRKRSVHDLVLFIVPCLKFQAYLWPKETEATALPPPMGGCTLHKVKGFSVAGRTLPRFKLAVFWEIMHLKYAGMIFLAAAKLVCTMLKSHFSFVRCVLNFKRNDCQF